MSSPGGKRKLVQRIAWNFVVHPNGRPRRIRLWGMEVISAGSRTPCGVRRRTNGEMGPDQRARRGETMGGSHSIGYFSAAPPDVNSNGDGEQCGISKKGPGSRAAHPCSPKTDMGQD